MKNLSLFQGSEKKNIAPSEARQTPRSDQEFIEQRLEELAVRLRAKVPKEAITLFALDLKGKDRRDIVLALERLGRAPRKPFEPGFPSSATLIEAVDAARASRLPGFTYCGSCAEGWLDTTIPALDGRGVERAVKRCPCVVRWKSERGI